MELKRAYNPLGMQQIEERVKEKYRAALNYIKNSGNPVKCIEHLQTMVGILKQSIPQENHEQEWLNDYLKILGGVREISHEIYLRLAQKYKRRPSKLEKITEKLESINRDIERLMDRQTEG